MREFNEVWNSILNKKYQKKIEAGYERISETYSIFLEKAQQMKEETEKAILLDRMMEFVKSFKWPAGIIPEEFQSEYWKMVATKCEKERKDVQTSIAEFDIQLERLIEKYPDEAGTLGDVKASVEKELERMRNVLIRECREWSITA